MYCTKCGKEVNGNFCMNCGTQSIVPNNQQPVHIVQQVVNQNRSALTCPRCGSHNISVQAVATQKKRGCFASIMWILLAVCTLGIILLIPILTKKGSKMNTFAVCQDCGHRWKK